MHFSSPDPSNQKERLEQLGFDSIGEKKNTNTRNDNSMKSTSRESDNENVQVTELDVDAVTLTAVGFTLIGLNFFVFANLGDGGIGGVVATLINKFNEL